MCHMSPELAHQLTAVDPAVLGARIKAARVAAGLTQPALAGKEASVAYVSRIESGQRRPGTELLRSLATKLGVTLDYLILGEGWEDAQRLELMMDHAELALVGGEGAGALARVREVLASPGLDAVQGGHLRAQYLEAAALDTLGDAGASRAFQRILQSKPDHATRLKAATALCRIWREQGQLDRSIACAQEQLNVLPPDALGTEEGVRLSVTLAAALSLAGRVAEAVELCDDAIAEAERLSSPVARASAYWNASLFRYESGEMSEALTLAKRALHLLESTERVRDLGRLRTLLSMIMLKSDPPRLEDAQHHLKIADVELDWSSAAPADRAWHDFTKAQALYLSGAVDEAHVAALAVVESTQADLPIVSVNALTLLGQIAWSNGEREDAQQWYRRAITMLTGYGADREAAQVWFEIGTLAAQAGLVAESADAFQRAAASTGLTARLPVINTPPASSPRTTPAHAPAGRVPVINTPPANSPRTTPAQSPSSLV
jgi:transcriptional regulator with XRE-family HTH domain